jgi:hypothetical protein
MEVFNKVKIEGGFEFCEKEHFHCSQFEWEDINLKVEMDREYNFTPKPRLTLHNIGSKSFKVSSFSFEFSEGRDEKLDFVLESNKEVFFETLSVPNSEVEWCNFTVIVERLAYGEQEARKKFVDGLAAMKNDDALVDVTIRCEEEEFRCHRAILAAHSEFFKTIFAQTGFKEGASREVKVKDISRTTLKEVLNYVYSDCFDEKTDIPALFDAAHLYGIKGLVLRCENTQTNALTIQNAAELFYKGYLTGSIRLKTAAMSFIAENFILVKETSGWSNFLMSPNSPKAYRQNA